MNGSDSSNSVGIHRILLPSPQPSPTKEEGIFSRWFFALALLSNGMHLKRKHL
jgi:hypothetical protein